jgi:hypothetical protein
LGEQPIEQEAFARTIDSQHEPNGLRELRNNKLYAFELPDN